MCVFFLENGEKKASITLQPEINLHYSKVFSLASRVNTKNAAKRLFSAKHTWKHRAVIFECETLHQHFYTFKPLIHKYAL